MNLYTEEQLVYAMSLAASGDYYLYYEILQKLNPIKLPSNEEINNFEFHYTDGENIIKAWKEGVEWALNEILNQTIKNN